jgi:hypothetical protein
MNQDVAVQVYSPHCDQPLQPNDIRTVSEMNEAVAEYFAGSGDLLA